MTIINSNRGVVPPYSNPINSAVDKTSSSLFGKLLATSVTKTSLTPVDSTPPTSGVSFASQLNDSLRAYGINVPPAIRITTNGDSFKLSGDNRDEQFQNMLKDRPDMAQGLSSLIGGAIGERKIALDDVMSSFAGNYPSGAVSQFLKGFEAAEKPKGYSVKFNGVDASVEEQGDKGWEPVNGQRSFAADLLEAYTAYLNKNQVRSTSDHDKDKPDDATVEMNKKLEDAKSAKEANSV